MPGPIAKKTKCKIVLLGAERSGKTQLIRTLANPKHPFQSDYRATLGAEFYERSYQDTKFELWDTAGQQQLEELNTAYYRNTDMVVLCLDVTQSFIDQNIEKQINSLNAIRAGNNQPIPLMLVLTKGDKADEGVLADVDVVNLQKRLQIEKSDRLTLSTKANTNLDKLFELMLKKALAFIPNLENTMTPMHKALALIPPGSDLHVKITRLNECIADFTEVKRKVLEEATFALLATLEEQSKKEQSDLGICAQAIETFERTCIQSMGSSYPRIAPAVLGVVVTAVVAVLAAVLGYAIGFLAGLWSGPGAFVTGLIAASAAATAVVAASSAIGLGGGFFAGRKLSNHLHVKNEPILDVVESARVTYGVSV